MRQVLEDYDIGQNRVAVEMEIGRSNVYRWVNEVRDPSADMVIRVRDALYKIDSEAAQEFARLYWGEPE